MEDLKFFLLKTEMYNSKDTIIESNPPEKKCENLTECICAFFRDKLQSDVTPTENKTCYYLDKDNDSAKVIKSVYFHQKIFLWRSKRQLFNLKNKKKKPAYFTECLPPQNRNLLNLARDKGIKAVTHNCKVQLFVANENGKVTFRPVYSSKDIEQLEKAAVKMQNRQSRLPDVGSATNGARVSSSNGEVTQRYNTDRKRGHGNSSTGYTPEGKSVMCKEKVNMYNERACHCNISVFCRQFNFLV